MAEQTRLSFESPLQFQTLDAQLFEARAVELIVDAAQVRLQFHVSRADHDRMLARSLFNLLPEVRAGELPEGDDLEVTARLRGELVADLGDNDAESIASALVEGGRHGVLGALASTESWLVEAVTVAMETPPGVEGSLRAGYRTRWGGNDAPASVSMRGAVEALVEGQGWDAQRIGDDLIAATIHGDNGTWRLLLRTSDELCTIASVHPVEVPAAKRGDAAIWLTSRSHALETGAFDLDGDGEIRVKTVLFAEGFSRAALGRAVMANLEAMDDAYDDLAALAS